MERFFMRALAAAIFFGGVLAGPIIGPLAAAIDPGYRQADHALTDALTKGDKKAVAALLDDRFKWVESNGKVHTKAQILEDVAPLAANNEGAIDVRTSDLLGSVERVLGIHHNMRFAHLWVKNTAGWQAFAFLDIPIPAERKEVTEPPEPPRDPNADCENPCRTLPFKPENDAQAGAMAAWFALKNAEWHPNPEVWDAHSDELHETISPTGDLFKLQHVADLRLARKLYGEHGAGPGEPVMVMQMFDFGGNVVIQENLQGPKGETKPRTWVMRVFINRGDGWKIALSAQTRITGP
jgi:hypothetical protein